jgi:hypothetical protein
MAQTPKTHHVWLHLLPTDIRKPRGSDTKKAHDFSIEKMTKSGPTSAVGKTGRVMVKVGITIDPDIFNQAIIEANIKLAEDNMVPIYETETEVETFDAVESETVGTDELEA